MDQFRLRTHQAAALRRAEDLLEMKLLALVGEIDDPVGMPLLLPLLEGRQIGGGVEGGAVGLEDDAGRHLPGIRLPGHVHDQGAVALIGQAALPHILDHARNDVLHAGFAQPQVEGHVQVGVVFLHVGHRDRNDLLPEGPQSALAVLQSVGVVHGLGVVGGVLLGPGAGEGIDLLQLAHGEGGLSRIFSRIGLVEIRKVRLPSLELRDHQAHLQAPVAQVDVADDPVAVPADDPLDGLADDGAAEVSDVERFGHIGAAVVQDDGLRLLRQGHAEPLVLLHALQIIADEVPAEPEVEESRSDHRHLGETGLALQLLSDRLGDVQGRRMVPLGTGHGTVALIFTEVGTFRHRHPAQGPVIARGLKRLFHSL